MLTNSHILVEVLEQINIAWDKRSAAATNRGDRLSPWCHEIVTVKAVTYVGKDIAYQLWKFGRLGLDFQYRKWDAEGVWETGMSSIVCCSFIDATSRL